MPGDHQDLLEQLRRLRQREELARVHAARHQVVAGALRRGLRQDGRFDLEKPVGVEIPPHRRRDLVPQNHVGRQARAAEIQVAVLQAHVFRDRRLVGDRKRRRLRLVEDGQLLDDDLDLAGLELGIGRLGRAAPHAAGDADHVLRAQPLGLRHLRRVVVVEDDLRDARAVAHVHEQQAAEVAYPVDPAKQHHAGADVRRAERAAGMSASQFTELLSHVASMPRVSVRPRPTAGKCPGSARRDA
jgi:hypothetical protein